MAAARPTVEYLADGDAPLTAPPAASRAWPPLAPLQRSPRMITAAAAAASGAPLPKLAPLPPRLPAVPHPASGADAGAIAARSPPLSPPPRHVPAIAATGLFGTPLPPTQRPTPPTAHTDPPRALIGAPIKVHLRDYHDAVVAPQGSRFGSDESVRASCELDVPRDATIARLLDQYREASGRRYLHQPFVYITHANANEARAHESDAAATASEPAETKPSANAASTALFNGRLVHLPRSEFSRTLEQLRLTSGCTVTVRTQPFPIRVQLDNSALIDCDVPVEQLDQHSVQVWVQDHMTIAQLKEELLRQLRENKYLLGADRCRLFVHAHEGDDSSTEVTQELARTVASLPLTAVSRSAPLSNLSTLVVRQDPTRWLHEAIRDDEVARAEKLIRLGADAHLLDANGYSAFVHARSDQMRTLLQRAFPPSQAEMAAVRKLLETYRGWLHAGACVKLASQARSKTGGVIEEEQYVFIKRGQDQRLLITNELNKPIGEVDLAKGAPNAATVVPTNLDLEDSAIFASKANLPTGTADKPLPLLYPAFDRKPEFLLFSLDLKLVDRVKPITLRSPPYASLSVDVPEIASLQAVSRFRAVVTRFDLWKNLYIINLKMTMLLVSAVGAAYSFSVVLSQRKEWGQDEIVAGFVLTLIKAVVATIFLLRMTQCFGWRVAKSFAKIKTSLLSTGNERRLAEAYLYFFLLEAADAGILVTNVRMLASLAAGDVSLSTDNFRISHPVALSQAQSLQLSIYLSLASLVGLNLVDATISFLADETPSWRKRVHRYVALHLVVLVYCFSSLCVTYNLRKFQVDTGRGNESDGLLSCIPPATLSFMLAYLFGMSVKNLNGTFHPGANHREMDEQLNAKAIEADYRTSLLYVLLSMIVYGAAQNSSSADIDAIGGTGFYGVALNLYFASGLALSVTALLPFLMRSSGPPVLPEVLAWLPDAWIWLKTAAWSRTQSQSRVGTSESTELVEVPPQRPLRVTVVGEHTTPAS